MSETYDSLERVLGYRFCDLELLEEALSHRSVGPRNNERLEFLGDAVVDLIITEELYKRFPNAREGQMSRMRSELVNKKTLAQLSRNLDLGDYVRLGSGEKKSGANERDSVLANTLESLLGAMLLDGGIDACREQVQRWWGGPLGNLSPDDPPKDAKTRLQEYLQARHRKLPSYKLLGVEGESHNQHFTVACTVQGLESPTQGAGKNRREAEQAAAAAALDLLGEQ